MGEQTERMRNDNSPTQKDSTPPISPGCPQ
jgi:hypothetical protein